MARRTRTAPTSLDRALVTPEGVTLSLRLGTGGARAGAFVIDLLIMLAVMIGFTLLLVLFATQTGVDVGSAVAVIWLLGFFLLRNFWFVLHESGGRAATPGKRAMKLRVIARDGGRLTGGAVLARNMLREIEVFLPLSFLIAGRAEGMVDGWTMLLGFLWTAIFLFFPLFNRDRLRGGDLIAGTWVVESERRKIGRDLLILHEDAPRLTFTAAELAAYGQFELQRLEEVLRRDDPDAITTVATAVRHKLDRWDTVGDRGFLDAYYGALRLELERKLLFGKRKRDKFDHAA